MHPGKLYDTYLNKWKTDLGKNTQGPGVYTHPGWEVVEKNIESFVDADIVIRSEKVKSYTSGQKSLAQSVPPVAFKEDGTVDITLLSGGVVYYNPISKEWFTVSNAGTESAEPIVVESYIDGWNNIDQDKSSDSSQKTVDELSETDETLKTKKQAKIVDDEDYSQYTAEDFMPKSGTDVIEESIKTAGQTGEDINKFWEWVASPKGIAKKKNDQIVKKATGGRVNYAQGSGSLEALKAWWDDRIKDEG